MVSLPFPAGGTPSGMQDKKVVLPSRKSGPRPDLERGFGPPSRELTGESVPLGMLPGWRTANRCVELRKLG